MAGAGKRTKGTYQPPVSRVTIPRQTVAAQSPKTAVTTGAITGDSPAARAAYLRNNSKQQAMFSQGEDSPLFSGTASRATIDPYRKKQSAYQTRLSGESAAQEQNPLKRSKDDYTKEYWASQAAIQHTEKEGEWYEGELQELKDSRRAEADISRAARNRGYTPGQMTPAQWAELSADLKQDAVSELKTATQAGRAAAGNKAVGRRTRRIGERRNYVDVGGQTYERQWKGGSQKAAQKEAARLNRASKGKAEAHMARKLVSYGYSREKVDNLSYSDKTHLVDEIGTGRTKKGRIGGMPQAERRQVIGQTSPTQRENAQMVSANPRAAKGIDTWHLYELAATKAGHQAEPLPYQYLEN